MNTINPDEPQTNNSDHLVILIHGFNTRAYWMNDVRPALQQHGFAVGATSFGYFGFPRFLSFPICRNAAKERVLKAIRTAISIYQDDNNGKNPSKISVISHSFGSWLFMQIIKENPTMRFYRIILCGSILREDYDFDPVLHTFSRPLLNHIGTKDYWPAIGESAGWGYGSIGAYGLNHSAVENRWHKGFRHSDFLTAAFCSKFWVPFLEGKEPITADKWQMLPLWVRAVTFIPLRWIIVIIVAIILILLAQFLSPKVVGFSRDIYLGKAAQVKIVQRGESEATMGEEAWVKINVTTPNMDGQRHDATTGGELISAGDGWKWDHYDQSQNHDSCINISGNGCAFTTKHHCDISVDRSKVQCTLNNSGHSVIWQFGVLKKRYKLVETMLPPVEFSIRPGESKVVEISAEAKSARIEVALPSGETFVNASLIPPSVNPRDPVSCTGGTGVGDKRVLTCVMREPL